MSDKYVQLEMPKRPSDLRIRHLSALNDEVFKNQRLTNRAVASFVAKFNGLIPEYVYSHVDIFAVKRAYAYYIQLFATMKIPKKPLQEIKIAGVEYELVNIKRPPTGFVMDSDLSDFEKDPVRLACMCYIPKGSVYGEMDKHNNMLYPIEDRYKEFEKEFPLSNYVALNTFFLRRYVKSALTYTAYQKTLRKLKRLSQQWKSGYRRLMWWRKRTTEEAGTKQNFPTSTTSTRNSNI